MPQVMLAFVGKTMFYLYTCGLWETRELNDLISQSNVYTPLAFERVRKYTHDNNVFLTKLN